jgi:molybdate transport system substrate-binding protein
MKMLPVRLFPFLLLIPLIVGACVPFTQARRASSQTLDVFAAASLYEVFADIETEFETQYPEIDLVVNFAGSQTLRLQIEQGAQFDVFASADHKQMQGLIDKNFLHQPVDFTENQMVLITPKRNPGKIHALKDLTRPGLKLVLASDTVPAGRYARLVLGSLNHHPHLGTSFETSVLRNLVSEEDNVKGVVTKVQLGEADAGIVYTSDLIPQVHAVEIPSGYNVLATYPMAIATNSQRQTLAQRFVDFVLSSRGQTLLASHGFQPIQLQALGQQP